MALMLMMLFVGCQEEYIEITEPDKNTAFSATDTIAELILQVTMKDGSFDNFVDNCSAISIKFPYSVQVRNEAITITSTEDIENLEQEYFSFKGSIRINYPVTLIFSDYSETYVTNKGELQKIQTQNNTSIEDDDIECIDFIYPIELSLYNTEFQKPELLIAGNDKDLHVALLNMDDLIVEISYPIVVEKWDGSSINIQSNKELQNEITNAMGQCNEKDEVDVSDENYPKQNNHNKINENSNLKFNNYEKDEY